MTHFVWVVWHMGCRYELGIITGIIIGSLAVKHGRMVRR